MATRETKFKKGNTASRGVKKKPGRPPNFAKMALRDVLLHDGEENNQSLRDEALAALRRCLVATNMDGSPSSVQLNAAKLVLQVTDAVDMHVTDEEEPDQITVTVEYGGGLERKQKDLPTYAPRRPVENTARGK
jgi:hypothetical protein